MTLDRIITLKYKNFKYDEKTKELLNIPLNAKDEVLLMKIYDNYKSSKTHRGYEYIIKDLYILVKKRKLSTSDIADIYNVGVRTIQIWLKELGLSRTLKEAQKIAVKKRLSKSTNNE